MLTTDALKTSSKTEIFKTAEATDDQVGQKIADKTKKITSKSTHEKPRKLVAVKIDKAKIKTNSNT